VSEHDNDIEFDFFEEEPPTQEATRTDRLIRRPGPRGPRRPPRAPANLTPLLRLVGLIAFAILIIVLLVFWIQSCNEAGTSKTYKSYMSQVSEVAGSSQQIGRQLSQALLAQGVKQAEVERRISGLARQEQLNVDRAREITPPGALIQEHQALIEALQLRVSGLAGLADSLRATIRTKDVTRAATVTASQMQRLLASDVVYDDLFKDPSSEELRSKGVTGTNENGGPLVPDSNFLLTAELATATGMEPVLQKFRGSTTTTTGGLRGTNIENVKVLPSGQELNTDQNTITVTTNMAFQVAVKNSGESQEAAIPVTLRIVQTGSTITKRARIDFITPGETKTVTFSGFPPPKFGQPAQIKVEVQPVQGETNTDNNSADFPAIFSVPA